jgi:hypothetical protein
MQLETGKLEFEQSFTTFSLEPYLARVATNEVIFALFGLYYAGHLAVYIARQVAEKMEVIEHKHRTRRQDRSPTLAQKATASAKKAMAIFTTFLGVIANGWVFTEILRLSLCVNICSSWVALLSHPQNQALKLPVLPQEEVDLHEYAADFRTYKQTNGTFIIICLARLMYYFSQFNEAGVLVHCVVFAAKYLVIWFVVAMLCFLFFAVMGMMMFGSSIAAFSTIDLAFIETVKMLFDQGVTLSDLSGVDSTQALIFFGAYIGVSTLLLLNIFLAILMDAYAAINEVRRERNEGMQEVREAMAKHVGKVSQTLTELLLACRTQIETSHTRLQHNPENGRTKMVVEVIQARRLKAMDMGGTSDPFVALSVGSKKCNLQRTLVAKKTTSPKWNEEFLFEDIGVEDSLSVVVKDMDRIRSQVLGKTEVDLSTLVAQQGTRVQRWYALEGGTGEVELSIQLPRQLVAHEVASIKLELARSFKLAKALSQLCYGSVLSEELVAKWDVDGNGLLDADEVIDGLAQLLCEINGLAHDYHVLIKEENLVLEMCREFAHWLTQNFGTEMLKQWCIKMNHGHVGTVETEAMINSFSALHWLGEGLFDDDGEVGLNEWNAIYTAMWLIQKKYTKKQWTAKYYNILAHDNDGVLDHDEFKKMVHEEGLSFVLRRAFGSKPTDLNKNKPEWLVPGFEDASAVQDEQKLPWDLIMEIYGIQATVVVILKYGHLGEAEEEEEEEKGVRGGEGGKNEGKAENQDEDEGGDDALSRRIEAQSAKLLQLLQSTPNVKLSSAAISGLSGVGAAGAKKAGTQPGAGLVYAVHGTQPGACWTIEEGDEIAKRVPDSTQKEVAAHVAELADTKKEVADLKGAVARMEKMVIQMMRDQQSNALRMQQANTEMKALYQIRYSTTATHCGTTQFGQLRSAAHAERMPPAAKPHQPRLAVDAAGNIAQLSI